MMSGAAIAELSRQAAVKAAREHKRPLIVEQDDLDACAAALAAGRVPNLGIPFIGSYRPRGYRPVGEPLFVDSSGFGAPGEPALTQAEFVRKLRVGFAYAVVEAGQFQCYVQEFRPPRQSRAQEAQPDVRQPYQPKTGARCSCKRGVQRDNCPACEGTGWVIDFAAIRARVQGS